MGDYARGFAPIISYQAITGNNNQIRPSGKGRNYIIPSDNWEQQRTRQDQSSYHYYIIPSDNWEQQPTKKSIKGKLIISYQAITGNNNKYRPPNLRQNIISYQAITGNNNLWRYKLCSVYIISYQAITGNNNCEPG